MLNWTVPVGTVVPLACTTVAVIVIGWPKNEGFGNEPSVVVVPTIGGTPVPISETDWVTSLMFKLLSVRTNDPLKLPVAVGIKSMA